VSESRGSPRGGLSPRTLVIASAASGAAAIVVHELWRPGVLIGAIVTPIIVALVTEALNRPAQRLEGVTARPRRRGEPAPPPEEREPVRAPVPVEAGDEFSAVRVYRRRPPARRGLRLALATGLVGFAVAAVALTASELVFGGSVAGGSRTTYFGGGGREEEPTPTPTPGETPAAPDATPTPEATPTPSPEAGETPTPTPVPATTPTPAPESTPLPAPE